MLVFSLILLSDIVTISGIVLTVVKKSCSKVLFFSKLRILQWNIENVLFQSIIEYFTELFNWAM